MPDDLIVDQINKQLLQRLREAGCTTGRLSCEVPGTALIITLNGYKPEIDKPLYFWQWERPFTKLVWAYMESFQSQLAAFTVEIDVLQQQCHYHTTNIHQYKAQQQAAYKEEELAAKKKQIQYKQKLSEQTQPVGWPLAKAIAEKLLTGAQLGYSHRDYCGTGLQFVDGQFEYVELWDYAADVIQSFDNEKEFVEWLSQQSDASLAQLEAASPFYWGNQTITRKRLEEFIGESKNVIAS